VEEHNIPDDLIFNWDQTGVNLIPGGDWTMDKKGRKILDKFEIDLACKNTHTIIRQN